MSDFERFGMVGETPVDGVDVDVMQEEALKMGASPEFLAECLQKYGPDVLSTVTEGLRNGFSISFIFESFRLFGPFVMDFFISLLSKKKMVANLAAQGQAGFADLDSEFINALIRDSNKDKISSNLLKVVVEKLLPYIFEKYGQKILEALINAVEKAIDEDK